MSRTRKDRNNQWRIVKNSLLKKILHCYSEDIVGRRKDKRLNGLVRARLKKETNHIVEVDNMVGGKDEKEIR